MFRSQKTWILFWSATDILSLRIWSSLVHFIIYEVKNFVFSNTSGPLNSVSPSLKQGVGIPHPEGAERQPYWSHHLTGKGPHYVAAAVPYPMSLL